MRVLVPTDVPLHRPSVGADPTNMGSLMPPRIVKPYVYRGWGIDLLTAHLFEDMPRAEYEAKPKPKPKPKPKRWSNETPDWARADYVPPAPRIGDRRHPEHHLYYKSHPQPLGPEPEPVRVSRNPVRASPGWAPMTGSDMDNLLAEFDDDQT